MKRIYQSYLILVGLALALVAMGASASEAVPASKQIAKLKQDCGASAEARADRHAATPLYERLGGREGIEAFVRETVAGHFRNEKIREYFEGVERKRLAAQVTDFLVKATGGDATYEGRNMVQAHAHLDIDDAAFLAAGGDLEKAMRSTGQDEPEIEEVTCMFVSLHGQVVTD